MIWNFEDATGRATSSSGMASVLAGDAVGDQQLADEGFLYAKNFTGDGELHDFPFRDLRRRGS